MSPAPTVTPTISIVVPTYRRPEKLTRALGSLAQALSQPYEAIVIDDCPDGSAFAVARQFHAQYVHKAGRDRGQSASRNIGMTLARGRWLCFLDDDDFFMPQGLDRLLIAAESGGQVVFGDYQAFNAEARAEVPLAGITLDTLLVCNQIPMGAFVMDRGAVVRSFDTRMRSHEDWDFLLTHILRSGMQYVPGAVVVIDKTENQTTSTEARRRKLFWLDFLSIYARFPASHLSTARGQMLASLGIQMPDGLLQFDDEI
jgi:glycosyltransferase involved in cell wall biosynthesis